MTARIRVPYGADERTMLLGFLAFQRQTLRMKTDRLDAGLTATHPPSTLTLAGLVKHLAQIEDWWFGEPTSPLSRTSTRSSPGATRGQGRG